MENPFHPLTYVDNYLIHLFLSGFHGVTPFDIGMHISLFFHEMHHSFNPSLLMANVRFM